MAYMTGIQPDSGRGPKYFITKELGPKIGHRKLGKTQNGKSSSV